MKTPRAGTARSGRVPGDVRSRPESQPPDPLARRLRDLRLWRGMTLKQLAVRATLALGSAAPFSPDARRSSSVSVSYLSLIENGHKVPDEPIAVALAEALGEDARLLRAWVRARKRSDLDQAISAAETLRHLVARPDERGGGESLGEARRLPGLEPAATPTAIVLGATASSTAASGVRLRLPVIPEGADPGGGIRPECEILEWRRLDAELLPADYRRRLDRPFAMRPGSSGARRVRAFRPGDYVVVLRDFLPLTRDDAYAVRQGGRVVLSRVIWNGRSLLLLPADAESDFELVEARDESRLRELILGVAIVVRFAPEGGT